MAVMTTWGLDLSTDPKKCAGVAIRWDGGLPEVADVRSPLSPDEIVDLIRDEDCQFAVDVPFGWPDAFVDFVAAHREGAQQPPRNRDAWRKETLARRLTDDRLIVYKALPLPASFDRLGKTAVMWSAIEFDLRNEVRIDRSGMAGRVCETYPAAALAAWSLPKTKPTIEMIYRAFPFLTVTDRHLAALESDDARDALVCALVARARALDITVVPSARDMKQARREGWIHVSETDPRGLLGVVESQRWLSVPLYVPTAQDLSEDGAKRTFDFWREDNTQIAALEELAIACGSSLGGAAEMVIRYAVPTAVPPGLSREAWCFLANQAFDHQGSTRP